MFKLLVALVMFVVIFRIGLGIIRMFAQPVPEPPPPGELRKVDLRYRCALCGAEMRMTRAGEDLPPPPRHCMEDMDLVRRGDD